MLYTILMPVGICSRTQGVKLVLDPGTVKDLVVAYCKDLL